MAHLLHSFGTMDGSWDYCGKGACRLCSNSTIELVSMFQTSHYAVNVLCSLRTICLLLLTPSLAYAIDVAGVTNTVGAGRHAVRCYREDPRPSGDVPMGEPTMVSILEPGLFMIQRQVKVEMGHSIQTHITKQKNFEMAYQKP